MARILAVDDSAYQRSQLVRSLERDGHAVTEAADGADALQLLDLLDFDGVLLDLMMPEVGGLEVLRRLVGRRDVPPIVVLTAEGHGPIRDAALRFGAVEFLTKPAAPEDLRRVVDRFFRPAQNPS
ncbi:MAG: response regulator [Planctomycetia bacterium]